MSLLSRARIETWALGIVSRVESGSRVEDSRVELKREWIPPEKAARRLAGHANAAHGDDILWIFGLDEASGVVGADAADFAEWWSSVSANFDGAIPTPTELMLHVGGKTLCAVAFETTRPPYVIRNPQFGQANGGPISLEVPWREGTSVRTANRNDLLRLLTGAAAPPEVEILGGGGSLRVRAPHSNESPTAIHYLISLTVRLYLVPRGEGAVVIPFHRCSAKLIGAAPEEILSASEVTMQRAHSWDFGSRSVRAESVTMEHTAHELVAEGPGRCELRVTFELLERPAWIERGPIKLRAQLAVIDAPLPVVIDVVALPRAPDVTDLILVWELEAGHG